MLIYQRVLSMLQTSDLFHGIPWPGSPCASPPCGRPPWRPCSRPARPSGLVARPPPPRSQQRRSGRCSMGLSLVDPYRIHVWYIYANIYHQYTPNVSINIHIYTSTMDPMGYKVMVKIRGLAGENPENFLSKCGAGQGLKW